jgi:PTS system mannitol-specific IIC component
MKQMKGKKSTVADSLTAEKIPAAANNYQDVRKVVFACDAGMGSSAMGASVLKNKMKKAELDVDVTNTAIAQLPNDADVVITHKDLTSRAKEKLPNAIHLSVENFLNSPIYEKLVADLKEAKQPEKDLSQENQTPSKPVGKVIFACDAGMGSSAMGASVLKNKFKKAGIDVEVTNSAINNLPGDADIIITHKDLTERAKAKVPQADHISVDNFLNSPKYDELVEQLKK